MINKILATIDCSDRSQSVFEMAVSLAQATRADLMLLHILSAEDSSYPTLPTHAYYAILHDNDDGIFHQKFEEYKQQKADFLRKLTQKAISIGIEAEYTQLNGIPGKKICELASAWPADLILVGSRGLKGLKEIFIGSVSNYVTHHAPCSVLIVRSDTDSAYSSTSPLYAEETKAKITKQEVGA